SPTRCDGASARRVGREREWLGGRFDGRFLAAGGPAREPGFEQEDYHCGHDEPTPEFLAGLQFGILEPDLARRLRGNCGLMGQGNTQPLQLISRQRRGPAFPIVKVDGEVRRLLRLRGAEVALTLALSAPLRRR